MTSEERCLHSPNEMCHLCAVAYCEKDDHYGPLTVCADCMSEALAKHRKKVVSEIVSALREPLSEEHHADPEKRRLYSGAQDIASLIEKEFSEEPDE